MVSEGEIMACKELQKGPLRGPLERAGRGSEAVGRAGEVLEAKWRMGKEFEEDGMAWQGV